MFPNIPILKAKYRKDVTNTTYSTYFVFGFYKGEKNNNNCRVHPISVEQKLGALNNENNENN